MSSFDQTTGWCALAGLLTHDEISAINRGCQQLRQLPEGERVVGDKPHAGTHHLVRLDDRIPEVAALLGHKQLVACVAEVLGAAFGVVQASYRSPQPGFGGQRLHADALPKLAPGPDEIATAIVPLVDFTATNGSTRVVPGSHQRVDLQRLSGQAEHLDGEMQLTGSAGTAFVFSGHLLHSGTMNLSDDERPALQLQWRRSH